MMKVSAEDKSSSRRGGPSAGQVSGSTFQRDTPKTINYHPWDWCLGIL